MANQELILSGAGMHYESSDVCNNQTGNAFRPWRGTFELAARNLGRFRVGPHRRRDATLFFQAEWPEAALWEADYGGLDL